MHVVFPSFFCQKKCLVITRHFGCGNKKQKKCGTTIAGCDENGKLRGFSAITGYVKDEFSNYSSLQ